MGLPSVNLLNPYPCTLSTLGPAKEEWGPDIIEWITKYWQKRAITKTDPRLKFETSNDGYTHFHLALYFEKRQKYAMFTKDLQKYMRKYKNDKPPGYDKNKEFSFRMYAVPTVETHNAKVLRGSDLINAYLENPTKEKSTEGGNFIMEIDGFNGLQHIKDKWETIPTEKTGDPIIDEYRAVVSKSIVEMKAYLLAWQKFKGPLPDLNRHILENRPKVAAVSARFSKICPKTPA